MSPPQSDKIQKDNWINCPFKNNIEALSLAQPMPHPNRLKQKIRGMIIINNYHYHFTDSCHTQINSKWIIEIIIKIIITSSITINWICLNEPLRNWHSIDIHNFISVCVKAGLWIVGNNLEKCSFPVPIIVYYCCNVFMYLHKHNDISLKCENTNVFCMFPQAVKW